MTIDISVRHRDPVAAFGQVEQGVGAEEVLSC